MATADQEFYRLQKADASVQRREHADIVRDYLQRNGTLNVQRNELHKESWNLIISSLHRYVNAATERVIPELQSEGKRLLEVYGSDPLTPPLIAACVDLPFHFSWVAGEGTLPSQTPILKELLAGK